MDGTALFLSLIIANVAATNVVDASDAHSNATKKTVVEEFEESVVAELNDLESNISSNNSFCGGAFTEKIARSPPFWVVALQTISQTLIMHLAFPDKDVDTPATTLSLAMAFISTASAASQLYHYIAESPIFYFSSVYVVIVPCGAIFLAQLIAPNCLLPMPRYSPSGRAGVFGQLCNLCSALGHAAFTILVAMMNAVIFLAVAGSITVGICFGGIVIGRVLLGYLNDQGLATFQGMNCAVLNWASASVLLPSICQAVFLCSRCDRMHPTQASKAALWVIIVLIYMPPLVILLLVHILPSILPFFCILGCIGFLAVGKRDEDEEQQEHRYSSLHRATPSESAAKNDDNGEDSFFGWQRDALHRTYFGVGKVFYGEISYADFDDAGGKRQELVKQLQLVAEKEKHEHEHELEMVPKGLMWKNSWTCRECAKTEKTMQSMYRCNICAPGTFCLCPECFEKRRNDLNSLKAPLASTRREAKQLLNEVMLRDYRKDGKTQARDLKIVIKHAEAAGIEATESIFTATFKPGKLEIESIPNKGTVTKVNPGGQGDRNGLVVGMLWHKIDGKPYTREMLISINEKEKDYEISFKQETIVKARDKLQEIESALKRGEVDMKNLLQGSSKLDKLRSLEEAYQKATKPEEVDDVEKALLSLSEANPFDEDCRKELAKARAKKNDLDKWNVSRETIVVLKIAMVFMSVLVAFNGECMVRIYDGQPVHYAVWRTWTERTLHAYLAHMRESALDVAIQVLNFL